MSVQIRMHGLDSAEKYIREFPAASRQAKILAVNDTARYGARRGSEAIRKEVAFSRGYLGDASNSNSKLRITRLARGSDAEAIISAREVPTSLARFATGAASFGKRDRGPRVKVRAGGSSKQIKGGFFVKLRAGTGSDDAFNIGLAVRLKPGERVRNKRQMKSFGKGLYLLYAPSVAQVFDTVRDDIAEDVGVHLETEFLRQFERLTR